MVANVPVPDSTATVAPKFGQVQGGLPDAGTPAPVVDLLNVATAFVHDRMPVTQSVRHYADIPGL